MNARSRVEDLDCPVFPKTPRKALRFITWLGKGFGDVTYGISPWSALGIFISHEYLYRQFPALSGAFQKLVIASNRPFR
jgi:hypothetical protein